MNERKWSARTRVCHAWMATPSDANRITRASVRALERTSQWNYDSESYVSHFIFCFHLNVRSWLERQVKSAEKSTVPASARDAGFDEVSFINRTRLHGESRRKVRRDVVHLAKRVGRMKGWFWRDFWKVRWVLVGQAFFVSFIVEIL